MSADVRTRLIEQHLPLVTTLARRFDHRGERLEDLVQVGAIGLIKAVDRFEPERGVTLGAFAAPTIAGEIKRHLRDRTWPLAVPRRLRESRPLSEFVDPSVRAEEPTAAGTQAVIDAERARERGEDRALLTSALEALDGRKRHIVQLRFYSDLSQAEIAVTLGISQAQVSRLLQEALVALRGAIGPADPSSELAGAAATRQGAP
jgi:RNA polymerase sigma-B factor